MSFAEKIKLLRTERHLTQEEFAEQLEVSRQAVSKWESGNGYPETEKLLQIVKQYEVSLDYLMLEENYLEKKKEETPPGAVYPPNGKIAIRTFDKSSVVVCHAVKISDVFLAGKGEAKCLINGIDKVTFWGEHSITLGWYASREDAEKEIEEIHKAITEHQASYELKYNADVKDCSFGIPKLKEK